MLSLGVETWSKSIHKVGFTRKARVLLGLQGQTPGFPASGPWRLAPGLRKTFFCAFQKPCGLSPLAQIKCSRARTFRETSGTPSDGFRNLSGDQTLLSTYQSLLLDHSGVARHIRDLIQNSEQHSVTNIHNSYSTISSTNIKHADPTGSRTM